MKIAIFYHIGQLEYWVPIYQSQLHRLYVSGLIKNASHIHFGISGNEELFNIPNNAKLKRNTIWESEVETLLSLQEFSEENPDYKILYLHTKGASKGTIKGQSWRMMMEYFVIDKWRECVKYLDEYDCVGAEINTLGKTLWSDGSMTDNDPTPFFIGNFWWANSSYIRTLKSRHIESPYRLDKEWWIGDGKNGCKPKNLFKSKCKEGEEYEYYFHEEEYV